MPFILNSSVFSSISADCPGPSGLYISSSVRVYELPENLLLHIVLDFVEYDIVKLDHPQHHVIGSRNHVMNDESFDQVKYNHVSFQFSYLMELFLNLIQLKDVDAVRLSMNYLDDEENHDSNILRTIQYQFMVPQNFRKLSSKPLL